MGNLRRTAVDCRPEFRSIRPERIVSRPRPPTGYQTNERNRRVSDGKYAIANRQELPLSGHSRWERATARVGSFETFAVSRSGPRPPRDDGQIGTSLGRAGALHDVECCD